MDPALDLAPTGALRAAVNLGNPVLAQGDADAPRGVTVDLARDLAERLGVALETICFDAAKDSFAALRDGAADIAFLAVDPDRAADVAFTPPYVVIEGVFAVPPGSVLRRADDVDRPGVRVGVKEGSAYDLHLSRALRTAVPVRGAEGTAVARERSLEAAAGIRVPVTRWADDAGWTVLEPAFMRIRQAVALRPDLAPSTVQQVVDWIEQRKADGFVARSLQRSGRADATVAPAAA